MASISLPPQHRSGFSQHFPSPPSPNPHHNRSSTMSAPLPNPPFVFPARDPEDSKPQQSAAIQRRTPPALPAFSFNPGAGSSLQPPSAPNPRPSGHRRRPSEFVGGDQLVTPGAGESLDGREDATPPKPVNPPSGPSPGRGPGRRHHAHRRSAAISGVDLIAINMALTTNPAASAPSLSGDRTLDDSNIRPLSYSATSLGRPTPPASPRFPPVPPVPPIPTAIHIEPAPSSGNEVTGRPASAVSYDASPSPHSVKFEQPDQPELPVPVPRVMLPNQKLKPRPKTADASLAFDLMQSKNMPEVPAVKRSKSTGHSRSKKSRSTGTLDATLALHGSDDAQSTDASRPSYSDDGSEMSDSENEANACASSKKSRSKSKKKQKRIRSWAGGILTRKNKRHVKGDAEEKHEKKAKPAALTPPSLTRTNSEIGSVLEVDFDNDDVVVIRTPTNTDAPVSAAERATDDKPISVSTLETSWKPRSFYEQTAQTQDDGLTSPIIDLDAALGPFNTPGDNRPSRSTPSKFYLASQRMYSGGRRGEFVGPEMRYHRRTESAPVMPPFDRSALGAIRLTGSSALETPDVFYEEDEDAFLAANQSPKNEIASSAPAESPSGSAAQTPSADLAKKSAKTDKNEDIMTDAPVPSPSEPKGLGIQAREDSATPKDPPALSDDRAAAGALSPLDNPFAAQRHGPVEILKSEESVSKVLGPPSPDVSPRFLAIDKRPATSPQDLMPCVPPFTLSAGVSPSDSSFPSPDASRFNDRNFSSHSYHHLPSEYPYASVEDVPSLTSSASTMTGTVHRFSASFFPRARLSTDRAASFSATANRRSSQANSSKRSSLASLSKLVGGPHSERSKLSQEHKPSGDASEKSKKKRRLSRLMHFWKVKDKEKHTESTVSSDRSLHE